MFPMTSFVENPLYSYNFMCFPWVLVFSFKKTRAFYPGWAVLGKRGRSQLLPGDDGTGLTGWIAWGEGPLTAYIMQIRMTIRMTMSAIIKSMTIVNHKRPCMFEYLPSASLLLLMNSHESFIMISYAQTTTFVNMVLVNLFSFLFIRWAE